MVSIAELQRRGTELSGDDNAFASWDSILEGRSSFLRQGQRFGALLVSLGAERRDLGRQRPWGCFRISVQDNRSLGGITYMHMFSPDLISEARVGFQPQRRARAHQERIGPAYRGAVGHGRLHYRSALAGFPLINITNYASVGFAANEPVQFFVTDYQAADDMTWIKGKHI